MISREEVKKIAELARIELTEEDAGKYQKELSDILDFVGELSKADTIGVEPIRQITGLESVFRKDEPNDFSAASGGELIAQAPEHKDGFIVVPEVLKKK